MNQEILDKIKEMVSIGNLYVVNKNDQYMELNIIRVEVDPDGDIKLVAEISY